MMSEAEENDNNESCIAHILVVGFNHQYGAEVEFVYPPINVNTVKKDDNEAIQLPEPWQDLPNLCIPDGAHAISEDATFFHMPDIDSTGVPTTGTLYGISHYRSIDTKDLVNKSDEMTRTEVKKSVCILSKLPLYTLILSKLEVIIRSYFDEKDFTKTSILVEAFKNLSQSISLKMLNKTYINAGLSLREAFKRFKGKLISLFKLLMLEKKVLFYGAPVRSTCRTILSLISLMPGATDVLLPQLLTCQMAKNKCSWHRDEISSDEYGLPLKIFHKGVVFQPYVSLQQMDLLRDKRTINSFICGATNVLFLRHSLAHAIVHVENGVIEIRDPTLTRALSLTTEDLRFADYLTQNINSSFSKKTKSDASPWTGSDDWIRAQFKNYLLSLLATVQRTDDFDIITDFNHTFVNQWKATDSYHEWKSRVYSVLDDIPIGHPFRGSFTFSDVRMRLAYQLQDVQLVDQEQSKKLNQAMSNTGKAVGGAFSVARSKVSNWWSKLNEPTEFAEGGSSKKEYVRTKDVFSPISEGNKQERQQLLSDKSEQIETAGPFVVDDDDEDLDIDVLLSRGTQVPHIAEK